MQGKKLMRSVFVALMMAVECISATSSRQIAEWREMANAGDAEAQAHLGDCYFKGDGVIADSEEAVSWYRRAAENGNALSRLSLGVCYYKGTGVVQDTVEAYKWILLAEAAGCEGARAWRNKLYDEHILVSQVTEAQARAKKWERELLEKEHARVSVSTSPPPWSETTPVSGSKSSRVVATPVLSERKDGWESISNSPVTSAQGVTPSLVKTSDAQVESLMPKGSVGRIGAAGIGTLLAWCCIVLVVYGVFWHIPREFCRRIRERTAKSATGQTLPNPPRVDQGEPPHLPSQQ